MNAVELFLLGRTLMKIGEEAMPTEGIGRQGVRTVLIVVSDIREHQDTSVGEIATRTGLPQSAVSAAVARLREAGSIVTEPDPRDRRRLLIRPNPEPSDRVATVRAASVDEAVAAALDDPATTGEVVALLEALAQHLSPQALTRFK